VLSLRACAIAFVTPVAPVALVALVASQTADRDTDWPMHGGVNNIRYSALSQINRSNVAGMKVAWTYDSPDALKCSEMQSKPPCGWRAAWDDADDEGCRAEQPRAEVWL
jgi:hypothetical protein